MSTSDFRIRFVGPNVYEVLPPYKLGQFVEDLKSEFGHNASWHPAGIWTVRCSTLARLLDLCVRWWGEVHLRATRTGSYEVIKRSERAASDNRRFG